MAPTPLVFQELRYQIEELRTQEFTSPHTLHSDAPVLSFRRTTTLRLCMGYAQTGEDMGGKKSSEDHLAGTDSR